MQPVFSRWLAIILGAAAAWVAAELILRARYRRMILSPVARASGQTTIVALGDSITAGAPGDPATAWPAALGGHLRRNYPDVSWRIVNAGVSGDTAPLGYARFERDVAAACPQLVLIAFGLNDCNPVRYGMDRWFEAGVPAGLARSYLWRAIKQRGERVGRRLGWLSAPRPEAAGSPQPRTSPQGFGDTLDALVAKTRLIGARPVLLTMTPLAGASTEGVQMRVDAYPVYNRIIGERAAAGAVTLIQLASGAPGDAFEDDGFHLAAVGQTWVAGEVFRQGQVAGIWAKLAQEARP
ncbi:MAG: GDSL-type esterase/lipase family protein [Chloroflexi bacterium]|nr:GDSL-type esterase/lipase family protein [Chloroflexota bacterium]